MQILKKNNSVKEFGYFNNKILIGGSEIGKEIIFPTHANQISSDREICFYSEICVKNIFFKFYSSDYNTKLFRFEEIVFKKEELIFLSSLFSFQTAPYKYDNSVLVGSLSSIHKSYNACFGMIQECNSIYYLVIYASRRSFPSRSPAEDFYGDDIYYVHGIWEVELSEQFKQKIFPI